MRARQPKNRASSQVANEIQLLEQSNKAQNAEQQACDHFKNELNG